MNSIDLDYLKQFETDKTTSICVNRDNFIINITYKLNYSNTAVGIKIIDWCRSISLCVPLYCRMLYTSKKVVRGGEKNEEGSVEKETENEKRSRMREEKESQANIHTRTGTVSIPFCRLLACASLLPRYY